MRGLYGGFGMVCNFIALVHLKLSDATILFQTSGIFVLIFSSVFLKERVPKGAGKWLLLIFVAVMVMVNPFSFTGFTWYALVAILGAALSAGAYTTIRLISKRGQHSNFEIMAYFMITGMIAGLVTTDTLVMPQGTDWLISLSIETVGAGIAMFVSSVMLARLKEQSGPLREGKVIEDKIK